MAASEVSEPDSLKLLQRSSRAWEEFSHGEVNRNKARLNVKKTFKLLDKINLERYTRCLQKHIVSSKNAFMSFYLHFNRAFISFHSVQYLCIFKMKLLLNLILGDLNQQFDFSFKMSSKHISILNGTFVGLYCCLFLWELVLWFI